MESAQVGGISTIKILRRRDRSENRSDAGDEVHDPRRKRVSLGFMARARNRSLLLSKICFLQNEI